MGRGGARPDGGHRAQEVATVGRASMVEEDVLQAEETPVGRLVQVGSAALSVRELLALLLRARGARESAETVSARLTRWCCSPPGTTCSPLCYEGQEHEMGGGERARLIGLAEAMSAEA